MGGDIHLIETSSRYPVDFDDVRDLNHTEQAAGTLPALKSKIENMADYDTVYVGFPIWWYVAPTIINTFLEAHDLTGKRVVPFATSGGSGIERAEESLRAHCPGAVWKSGKLLNHGDGAAWAKSVIS